MKKLIIAAALAVASLGAHATVVAYVPFVGDGPLESRSLNLKAERGSCPVGSFSMHEAQKGELEEGCWSFYEGGVRLAWQRFRPQFRPWYDFVQTDNWTAFARGKAEAPPLNWKLKPSIYGTRPAGEGFFSEWSCVINAPHKADYVKEPCYRDGAK